MDDRKTFPTGRRPRAASDTYTALPPRVALGEARSRRASDASLALPRPATRDSASARSSLTVVGEGGGGEVGRFSYNELSSERASNQQQAFETLSGMRGSIPVVPPRAYEAPVAQNRAVFDNQYLYAPMNPRDSQQAQRSPLPQYVNHADVTEPSTDVDPTFLPTYSQFDSIAMQQPPKKKKVSARLKEFWIKISEELPLPSPPPSPDVTRRDSFLVNGTGGNGGQFALGGNSDEKGEYGRDMLVRAIQLNGETDVRNSLATDADVQLYGEPAKPIKMPFFLKNTKNGKAGNADGEKRTSYNERRKKVKHRIIFNQDSKLQACSIFLFKLTNNATAVDAQHRFIILLARALMRFGSPSHRIEAQLASLATSFELPAQFVHNPGSVQISFGQPEKHTSETFLVKSDTSLDLGRIHDTHAVYRAVVRDEITATEGRLRLEEIIERKPIYSKKLLFGLTFLQGFILCGSSFGGSLNDMWVSGLLSVLVMLAQKFASVSQLSSSGAEYVKFDILSYTNYSFSICSIFIAAIVSLVARALSARVPNEIFCYQSISSTGVAGLLPGSILRM